MAAKRSQRLMLVTAILILTFAAGLLYLWSSGTSSPLSEDAPTPPTPAGGDALEPEFLEWSDAVGGSPAELQKVLEQYRNAAADRPKDAEVLSNLGRVQLELGNGTDVVASFQAVADLNPQSSQYRFQLARAQCALARWDECITTLREAR
ncbi:MAG: hypothetical protein ACRD15_12985, partial [Vicinamibacterales bacterium]